MEDEEYGSDGNDVAGTRSTNTDLLCYSCGQKAVAGLIHNNHPYCVKCVPGATVAEIMAKILVIKDKEFIEYLKTLGCEE